jgi:hypothetical protein
MKKYIIITFVILVSSINYAQEKINLINLYKEWELKSLEKNGKIKNAEEVGKDETIIFFKNNKFKMSDSEDSMDGVWNFNYLTNTIQLTLVDINQSMKFKIVNLNVDQLDYISEEDSKMIFHFIPKQKRKL